MMVRRSFQDRTITSGVVSEAETYPKPGLVLQQHMSYILFLFMDYLYIRIGWMLLLAKSPSRFIRAYNMPSPHQSSQRQQQCDIIHFLVRLSECQQDIYFATRQRISFVGGQ